MPPTGPPSPRWPHRADTWALRTQTLHLPAFPLLMGIINVTPDSFSDGGQYASTDLAVAHAERLIEEGADLLDIGGESTRPYSEIVAVEEELQRVVPVIERVCRQTEVPVSIDTSKAEVARQAIDAGAEIINDVTALTGDSGMLEVAVESRAGICAMHMQGTPQTMQDAPHYHDVVSEIREFLRARRDDLLAGGVPAARICLDPGIGSRQDPSTQSRTAGRLRCVPRIRLSAFGRSVAKGFIAKVIGDRDASRMPGTVGVCLALARQGIQILRVHDVAAVRQALLLFEAASGLEA